MKTMTEFLFEDNINTLPEEFSKPLKKLKTDFEKVLGKDYIVEISVSTLGFKETPSFFINALLLMCLCIA